MSFGELQCLLKPAIFLFRYEWHFFNLRIRIITFILMSLLRTRWHKWRVSLTRLAPNMALRCEQVDKLMTYSILWRHTTICYSKPYHHRLHMIYHLSTTYHGHCCKSLMICNIFVTWYLFYWLFYMNWMQVSVSLVVTSFLGTDLQFSSYFCDSKNKKNFILKILIFWVLLR